MVRARLHYVKYEHSALRPRPLTALADVIWTGALQERKENTEIWRRIGRNTSTFMRSAARLVFDLRFQSEA
jgi:hypothetical protein